MLKSGSIIASPAIKSKPVTNSSTLATSRCRIRDSAMSSHYPLPLPPSYGHRFLLTAVCRTTRFVHAMPLREATSEAAASAFLNQWVQFFGVPSKMSSDNGASFTSNLWKGIMDKLHVEVKYSALYRPQSVGLIERQHRSIKDSLKACIEEMVDKHQDTWMDHLPFILLGKRVALQKDLGASASELTFGTNVRIPGQLLRDPGEEMPSDQQLQNLLHSVKTRTNNPAVPTSNHSVPEKPLKDLPDDITHVYTRQHKTTGLQCPYEGPFRVVSRPS